MQKLMIAEMRMIRWMCGHILDRIKNEVIREKAGMATIDDMIREVRFRWLDGWLSQFSRKEINANVRKCERIDLLKCKTCGGRPKKIGNEVIREDIGHLRLTKDITQDSSFGGLRLK